MLRLSRIARFVVLTWIGITPGVSSGAELKALAAWFRPDPFGGILPAEREGAAWLDRVQVKAARGGYVSFQLVVAGASSPDSRLDLEFPLPADVFREWFHQQTQNQAYVPDALIPLHRPYSAAVPDIENQIPGQTARAYWVDIWIPPNTSPNIYRGTARLSGQGPPRIVPIELRVLPAVIPDTDAVTLDNNSYGSSWIFAQYPKTLAQGSDAELFRLIHEHHRLFYEHRGTFHQLGYGHAGKVGPEFAPELAGSGRDKHIASWTRFDQHYGPLLDGSAFRDSRRGARPIPFMYLPINPEWPASYLWWGEPGYETEFVNVVAGMEQHFRERNWTGTQFEVFFNHKKRYKGFSWDGDEARFDRDNQYLLEYGRLMRKAIPPGSPIHFVMRADTSWTMERQFAELKGVVGFWVAAESIYGWYPQAAREVKQRGDRVWTYGGTPAVEEVSTQITLNPLRSWISGVDGFVRWLTVSPGPGPWFHFEGGRETLIYPGERFGLPGPIPSIRLKLQRNCLEDLALLERAAAAGSRAGVQAEVVRRFNGTRLEDWQNTRPALTGKPPLEWNNTDIEEAMKPFEARFTHLDPKAWQRIHDYALEIAQ